MKSLSTAVLLLSATLLSTPGAALAASTTTTTTTTTTTRPSTASGTVPGAAGDPQGAPGTITDTRVHVRDPDLSVLFWLPWLYYGNIGVGGQVRFEIPIVPDGFIPAVNDEFAIEPSFGIAATLGCNGCTITQLAPAVYGVWRFHFSEEFSAYGALGLGLNFGIFSGINGFGGGATQVYFYFDPSVGLNYKFSSSIAFRGELGAQGLKAGLSFYF